MKEETKYKYVIYLLDSPYAEKRILSERLCGSKTDFEKFAKCSYRSSEFRTFFDELVSFGAIKLFKTEESHYGVKIKKYIIDPKKMLDFLYTLKLFEINRNLFNKGIIY